MVTMWSVKWRPNPGLARIASRSASESGWAEGLSSIVGVVMSGLSFTGCSDGPRTLPYGRWPILGRPSIPSFRGSAFDYRPGTAAVETVNAARWSMVAPGGDMRKPPGARGPGGFACGRERARSAGYPYGEGVADLGRAACGQVTAVREVGGDGVLDARGLGLVAEVAQQEGDGQDG